MRKSKLIVGENSLAVKRPDLLDEWNYCRNFMLQPENIYYRSNKSVWWKCKKCNHEWTTRVIRRTIENNGCICSRKYRVGEKPLTVTHPQLLLEWNYSKNINIQPQQISKGIDQKVWWKCNHGHEWQAAVYGRVNGNGCPYCAGKKANKENCLATTHPEISSEWDYEKNMTDTPESITRGCTKKIWWKCKHNHSWCTTANIRTNQLTGCPYCCGNLFAPDNSLQKNNPELAKEWHPTKNNGIYPDMVGYKSNKPVWWICLKGHEWKTKIAHRNNGSGCPFCKKIELVDGTIWDSKIEVFVYLWFKNGGIYTVHHGKYGNLGRWKTARYDFLVPHVNTYLEVTSFNSKMKNGRWFHYLRKIVKKRQYVERVLKARFVFISHDLSRSELDFIQRA